MAGRQFALERVLGDGAFGTVYLAELTSMGGFRKSVALKLLKPDWDAGSDAARRLRDEARLLGRLRHRHIVQVDDLIRLDGRWAVVMEYVPGVDLELLIAPANPDRVPPLAALEITAAIAQALDAAYNSVGEEGQLLRVVHRDIKPSNVRMTAAGDVKVLDFGIARAEFQGREAKTDNIRYGSLGYMAPERLLGDPEVPAGDVFAVGAVLYELLVGTPFGRAQLAPDRAAEMLRTQLDAAATLLPQDVHPALDLIAECMAYDVEDRPGSADVASRARAIARGVGGEDLFSYAHRVVPAIQGASVGRDVERRLLTEELGDSTLSTDLPVGGSDSVARAPSAPTFPHMLAAAEAPAAATAPTSNTQRTAVLIAGLAAFLVVLLVAALGGLYVLRAGDAAPAAVADPALSGADAGSGGDPAPVVERLPDAAAPAVADVAPADVPQPSVAPARVSAPAPVTPSAPAPAHSAPAQTVPVETVPAQTAPPEAAPAASGGQVDRVKFHVPGASRVSATCSGVSNSSTTASLNVLRFPAGSCHVHATIDGVDFDHRVEVLQPNGYTCTPSGERLTCTPQL